MVDFHKFFGKQYEYFCIPVFDFNDFLSRIEYISYYAAGWDGVPTRPLTSLSNQDAFKVSDSAQDVIVYCVIKLKDGFSVCGTGYLDDESIIKNDQDFKFVTDMAFYDAKGKLFTYFGDLETF